MATNELTAIEADMDPTSGKPQPTETKEYKEDDQAPVDRVVLTEEDNRRICRKTDKRILAILCWIYFNQIFDKAIFGLGNVYGLSADIPLTGNQFSFAGSIHAIAQLAWQPFSSYLIVRVPPRTLMTVLVLLWGTSAALMAASVNFQVLYVTRFFLGLFEAGCLPLFSIITAQWYRRSEQPLRIALWYGTNGISTVLAALMAYGFGRLGENALLRPWQALYLCSGLITVVSAPLVWMYLDNDIESARFLTPHEKLQAIERLRANQTGKGSSEWKWDQALEVFLDPKSYVWIGIVMFPNLGAAVTNIFGPTLLRGFGYDVDTTTLLTMPFGILQTIAILIGCYCAQKFRIKSAILAFLMLLAVAGCVMLYTQATASDFGDAQQRTSLGAYYLMSFLYGGNPLIVSWIMANVGGQTKKSVIMGLFNASSAAGNIIGPLLFKPEDAPRYAPGVLAVMAIFIALIVLIGIQVVLLFLFNKQRQRQRVAVGKPKFIKDTSMDSKYKTYGEGEGGEGLGEGGINDITDVKNNEFVYVY